MMRGAARRGTETASSDYDDSAGQTGGSAIVDLAPRGQVGTARGYRARAAGAAALWRPGGAGGEQSEASRLSVALPGADRPGPSPRYSFIDLDDQPPRAPDAV